MKLHYSRSVPSGSHFRKSVILWSEESGKRKAMRGDGGISTCIFFLHSWQFFFSAFLWSGAPHLRWGLCWGQVHVVSVLDVQEYESLLRGFVAFEEDWKWTLERINTKIDFFFFFGGYSSFWIFSSKQLKIFAESLNRPWTLYLFTEADGAESVDCGWLASKSRLSQMSQTSQTRIRAHFDPLVKHVRGGGRVREFVDVLLRYGCVTQTLSVAVILQSLPWSPFISTQQHSWHNGVIVCLPLNPAF